MFGGSNTTWQIKVLHHIDEEKAVLHFNLQHCKPRPDSPERLGIDTSVKSVSLSDFLLCHGIYVVI